MKTESRPAPVGQPLVDIHLWSSFTRNLLSVLLGSGLLIGGALSAVFIARQRASLTSALLLRVRTLSRSLARATFAPVLLEDRAALDMLLDGFSAEMDVIGISVYSADGRVLSQRPAGAEHALPNDGMSRPSAVQERRIRMKGKAVVREIIMPLRYAAVGSDSAEEGEISGYLRIAVSEERVDRQIRRAVRDGVALAVLLLVAAFAAGATLVKKMTERMRQFIEQVQTTAELERTNKELEAFSYSVSHDLRAPLRSIDGFSHALLDDYADKIDDTGKDYLRRVRSACQRMGQLIDDLLSLSRVIRQEVKFETVDLTSLARSVAEQLARANPERRVTFVAADGVRVRGDAGLLRIVLENLIGNAWKFTQKREDARIEFGTMEKDRLPTIFIKDNGAGFDMAYVDKLFGAFQRLHEVKDFPGTGIGLATVQRIIHRHGGRISAEGAVGKGAAFYIVLPRR